ncbi:MAG: hypothetical protein LUG99_01830 [Lachnospiraceae bacterium]|nr:hypothetical protein [Lachnospiraceae bacterium]
MKKQDSGKSRLFFIEFLIVLFFFLIIGTVCLRVFAAAHKITRNADALAHAQTTSASIAEVLEAGESFEDYFPEAVLTSETSNDQKPIYEKLYEISYDSDLTVCESEAAYYTLTVSLSEENHSQTANISFTDQAGESLYDLTVMIRLPLTREEALS